MKTREQSNDEEVADEPEVLSATMPSSRMLRRIALIALTLVLVYFLSDRIFSPSSSSNQIPHPPVERSSWNLSYHLGGNGPWIPHHSSLGSIHSPLPCNCRVTQVHMQSRHGERYPTKNAGARHLDLLSRLQSKDSQPTGPLSFLRTWTYFTNPLSPTFENLTTTGPYAGTLQAQSSGHKLRALYTHLLPSNPTHTPRFWTCSSPRDIETAQFFANGFFGPTWSSSSHAELEIIPETAERGADTLTPGDTCLNYINDKIEGHDKGYAKLWAWQDIFTAPIAQRLGPYTDGVKLSALDVYSMMELCGFELLVRGESPWCGIFTHAEWRDFEYARDLLHFYRAGPGNRFSKTTGWVYLNATANLLADTNEDESKQNVFLSFVHDGDIVPMISTLGLLDEDGGADKQELPTDHVKEDRNWVTSDVVPMGGRVIFERVTCGASIVNPYRDRSECPANAQVPGHEHEGGPKHYIRISINDGVVLDQIPLDQFVRLVKGKGEKHGNFREVCGLDDSMPGGITFLRP